MCNCIRSDILLSNVSHTFKKYKSEKCEQVTVVNDVNSGGRFSKQCCQVHGFLVELGYFYTVSAGVFKFCRFLKRSPPAKNTIFNEALPEVGRNPGKESDSFD